MSEGSRIKNAPFEILYVGFTPSPRLKKYLTATADRLSHQPSLKTLRLRLERVEGANPTSERFHCFVEAENTSGKITELRSRSISPRKAVHASALKVLKIYSLPIVPPPAATEQKQPILDGTDNQPLEAFSLTGIRVITREMPARETISYRDESDSPIDPAVA